MGAAVGGDAWIARHLVDRIEQQAVPTIDAIAALPDPHVASVLLRSCAQTQIGYSTRVTPPHCIEEPLRAFDAHIKAAWERIHATYPDDRQWEQICGSEGGMGVRRAAEHAEAAYVASRTSTRKLCTQLDPCFGTGPDGALQHAVAAYNVKVRAVARIDPALPKPLCQRKLSQAIGHAAFGRLLDSAEPMEAARLRAVAAPHAAAWLHAVPSPAWGQKLSPQEYTALAQWWVGQRFFDTDDFCPKCNRIMDTGAHHCMECMTDGQRTVRHNRLRDAFAAILRAAWMDPQVEQPGLLPEDPRRRPGDVAVASWPGGKRMAIDFAVVSTMQQRYLCESAQRAGAAAEAYERKKKEEDKDKAGSTAQRCAAQGITFTPFVVETYGAIGADGAAAVRVAARTYADRRGVSRSAATNYIYQQLSTVVQRNNVQMLLSRREAVLAMRAAAAPELTDLAAERAADQRADEAALAAAVRGVAAPIATGPALSHLGRPQPPRPACPPP
jgi:hypothetical protein